MIEKSGYYMNNRVARYMISSLQDLMGENGLNAVLRHGGLPDYATILPPDDMVRAFDFADYGAICAAVAETYGARGAKAFLIRAGRAGFLNGIQSFLDNYGASLEATGKLVPLAIKLPLFLRWIAKNYTETSDRIVRVKDHGDHYRYINERCPVCWGGGLHSRIATSRSAFCWRLPALSPTVPSSTSARSARSAWGMPAATLSCPKDLIRACSTRS